MTPTLSDVESLARQAGDILRAGFVRRPGIETRLQVHYKGAVDLVTEMDHRSEQFLMEEIKRRFPGNSILTEESGNHAGDACCLWYIDPLDGTVNYAHGVPIFVVSIAYAEGGSVRLGVVYDPMQDECFSAERGHGAWLNGMPIQVAQADDLDGSLLVTGFPYDVRTNPQNNLDHYARFALVSQGVRRLGAAALDLCYVANGRFDGYWELRLKPWDLAAGGLIAAEAGATVTDLNGGLEYLDMPCTILAANAPLHAQMLALLHSGFEASSSELSKE